MTSEASIESEKYVLRESAKGRRAGLSAIERDEFSAAILERVLVHPVFLAARRVLAYASHGEEVATDALISAALALGKVLLLPRVVDADGKLSIHVVADTIRDLRPGAWGIREPDPERCPAAADADLIVVPGVAFAPDGTRLGYGKGCYDRLLGAARDGISAPGSIALAFEVQMLDTLPRAPHDRSVDWIATERRLIDCRRN